LNFEQLVKFLTEAQLNCSNCGQWLMQWAGKALHAWKETIPRTKGDTMMVVMKLDSH